MTASARTEFVVFSAGGICSTCTTEKGFILPAFDGAGTGDALHHDPNIIPGQAQYLPDGSDGADAVQVGKLWIVYGQIFLWDQKEIRSLAPLPDPGL